jgi:hypothetical protein
MSSTVDGFMSMPRSKEEGSPQMRSRTALGLIGLLTAAVVVGSGSVAQAATLTDPTTDKCASVAVTIVNTPSTVPVDPAADDAQAMIKAQTDTYTEPRPERSAADDAEKAVNATRGHPYACEAQPGTVTPDSTVGPGYGYIGWMHHYGQVNGNWCGEATIEAISATAPGPSPLGLSQYTIASYMGSRPSDGTSTGQMTNALNHYVGVPDYGFTFYHMIFMNDNPTSAQRSAFVHDLQMDVDDFSSPLAGDAWEVSGGPHLAGHPNQEIFHWFTIGGWNTNSGQLWYTDSATSVWSSVPAYSWFNMHTAETIMGGRGYVW